MARTLIGSRTLLLRVNDAGDVIEVRLDYDSKCSDCGEQVSKTLTIDDCTQGQITAIKNIANAMIAKVS